MEFPEKLPFSHLNLTGMHVSNPIRDIHFSNPRAPKLGVEVMTLESFFSRGLEHLLEAPHRVYFYHIIFYTNGCGAHSIDFINHDFDEATLLLVSRGQVQQFQVNQGNTGYLAIFTSEFLYENATELNLFHSLQVFEHALFSPCIRLSKEQGALLGKICHLMHSEYQKQIDELSIEILRHFLRLILLQIGRIQQMSALSRRVAPHYQDFVAFRRLIERDLTQSRSVQHYAQQLAVTPKKLNELTRKVLNKSAKQFIEEQVILEAQRLLAQGEMPLKEIAYYLGFSEPTNMVKFFKKHTHISPASFRHQYIPASK